MLAIVSPCAALLSQGVYTGLISGIGTMTMGIYGSVKSIYNCQNPDLTNHIRRLDLEYQLRLISSVLKKQNIMPVIMIDETNYTEDTLTYRTGDEGYGYIHETLD